MTTLEDPITTSTDTGHQTLSERVEPYLAEIASRAQQTEDDRRVPAENIALVKKAGFVRSFVPKEYGGDERDLWDYVSGVRTVTKACPSTGWVTGVCNVHPVAVPQFRKSVRDAVWADGPDTWIVSSGTGVIVPELVDGGVVVTGRARWSSGCDHAEWAEVGLKMPDVGDGKYLGRSHRDVHFMAHRSEFTIEDTWQSKAVAGSGSNDLIFDSLFVSDDRLEALDAITFGYASGQGSIDNWQQRIPMPAVFSVFLPAIALGCADGMVEQFTKRQMTRKNAYTGAQGIKNPAGHLRLAESVHELESLTAYYKQLMEEMQAYGENSERLTEAKFHNLLARMPFITDRALQVVERLFVAAGSSAVASFNPMQRYWRDAHAARMHTGSDYDSFMQLHGRNMIGMPGTPDL
ncbi:MAG: acyl-CoA dehydrogenase family protein [Ilumatobacter sp.]